MEAGLHCVFSSDPAVSSSIFVGEKGREFDFLLFISVFTFSSKHQGWWIFRYCKTFCRGYAIHYKILENKNLQVHVINVVEFLRPIQGEVD